MNYIVQRAQRLSDLDIMGRGLPATYDPDLLEEWERVRMVEIKPTTLFRLPIKYPPVILECEPKGECSICLELLAGELIQLDCSHRYHAQCIYQWNKNSCPYCRQPIQIYQLKSSRD